MIADRREAGQRLADALERYRDRGPLVLAIPRGGVEVGFHVATRRNAELAVLVVRKLPLPHNPEAGFGAIAEDGSTFLFEQMAAALPPGVVEQIVREQKTEIRRRIAVLRADAPLPQIVGRTVILVDDGIAMGSTVRAAVALCRNKQAREIVVAAPVANPATADELMRLADDVVVVEKPAFFRAAAQVYENWYDVPDNEVIHLLRQFSKSHPDSSLEE